MRVAEYRFPKRKRKYTPGPNACSNCQGGAHNRCRPKLDGTVCSCSCLTARTVRSEVEVEQTAATNTGNQPRGVEEIARELYRPRYQRIW